MSDPASSRNAIIVIVMAQLATVLIGGVVIWLLDPSEYEDLTKAVWYILQTVTTVGYGDVTPADPARRLVGSVSSPPFATMTSGPSVPMMSSPLSVPMNVAT
jgi:hypothetical protein